MTNILATIDYGDRGTVDIVGQAVTNIVAKTGRSADAARASGQ